MVRITVRSTLRPEGLDTKCPKKVRNLGGTLSSIGQVGDEYQPCTGHASGTINLYGACAFESIEPVTEFAADGYISMEAYEASYETSLLDTTNYLADGYVSFGAKCLMQASLPSPYVADGFMEVGGAGRLDTQVPGEGLADLFVAAGSYSLSGRCTLASAEEVVATTAFVAGGEIRLGDPLPSTANVTYPPDAAALASRAFNAVGGVEISGYCIQSAVDVVAEEALLRVARGGYALSGFCGLTLYGIVGPTVSAFAAQGGLTISGAASLSGGVPGEVGGAETVAFAARGGYEFTGYCVRSEVGAEVGPDVTAYAAKGGYELSGICARGEAAVGPGVSAFAAKGGLEISGYSVRAGSTPGVATSADYAAQNGLVFVGHCVLGTAEEAEAEIQVSAFAARGGYAIYGVCERATVYPDTIETADFIAWGGYQIVGEGVQTISEAPPVYAFAGSGPLGTAILLGGISTMILFLPPVTDLAAMGGYVIETGEWIEPENQEVYQAWVLSGQAFEPSIFSGFKFNSLALHQGVTYAAGEEGIYILEGGDDDGEVIHTGARIGVLNFGTDREKRIRGIQFGSAGQDTRVRVVADNGEDIYFPERDDNRIVVGRNLQGREWIVDVADFEELSQFEITPLILARR